MTQDQIIEALEREHGLGMRSLSDRPHIALSDRKDGFIAELSKRSDADKKEKTK